MLNKSCVIVFSVGTKETCQRYSAVCVGVALCDNDVGVRFASKELIPSLTP